MNFEQAGFGKVSGTALQGKVTATYHELRLIFGEPNHYDGDDKVTCEWQLEFDDGTVATIYDWKMSYTPRWEYEWHIGGRGQRAVELVTGEIEHARTVAA